MKSDFSFKLPQSSFSQPSAKTEDIAIITLDKKNFVINYDQIEEITKFNSVITTIPGSKPWLLGLAKLKNESFPVIDLAKLLGLNSIIDESTRLIFIRHESGLVGLTADDIIKSEKRHWNKYFQNDKIVIARVDLATGTRFETIHTEIGQPVQSIFTSLDGQTIIITSRSITSFDAESKKQLWQTKTSGNIQQTSLVLDLDAVYFSQDLRELQKISMDDGHTIWQT